MAEGDTFRATPSIKGKATFEISTECLLDKDFPEGIPLHMVSDSAYSQLSQEYCGYGPVFRHNWFVLNFRTEECISYDGPRHKLTATIAFELKDEDGDKEIKGHITCAATETEFVVKGDKMVRADTKPESKVSRKPLGGFK